MTPESDRMPTPERWARAVGAVTLQGLTNLRTNTRVTIRTLNSNDAPNPAIAAAARGRRACVQDEDAAYLSGSPRGVNRHRLGVSTESGEAAG